MSRVLKSWKCWVRLFHRVFWGHFVLCVCCCCKAENLMLNGLLHPDGHFQPIILKLPWIVRDRIRPKVSAVLVVLLLYGLSEDLCSVFYWDLLLFILCVLILSCQLIYRQHSGSTVCTQEFTKSCPCCSLMHYSYICSSKLNMPGTAQRG